MNIWFRGFRLLQPGCDADDGHRSAAMEGTRPFTINPWFLMAYTAGLFIETTQINENQQNRFTDRSKRPGICYAGRADVLHGWARSSKPGVPRVPGASSVRC
jgi:hypothetical protein